MSAGVEVDKVVVLGHTGFVGGHLMEWLRRERPTVAAAGCSSKEVDLTCSQSSLALREFCTPSTALVMCSGIKSNFGDSLANYARNVRMAENVAEALGSHDLAKVIFLSSVAVYGVDVDSTDISEDSKPVLDTFYGLSKFASERVLALAFGEDRIVNLRIPTVYGFGESLTPPTPSGFLKTYLKGEEVTVWGDGSELREFLYVDDLMRILDNLLFGGFRGTLNPSDGGGRSYSDALAIIGDLLSRDIKVRSRARTKDKVNKVYTGKLFRDSFPKFEFTSLEDGLRDLYAKETKNKECQ